MGCWKVGDRSLHECNPPRRLETAICRQAINIHPAGYQSAPCVTSVPRDDMGPGRLHLIYETNDFLTKQVIYD